jgi:hypothetical protein
LNKKAQRRSGRRKDKANRQNARENMEINKAEKGFSETAFNDRRSVFLADG